jgi:hypothetical protein
MPMMKALQPIRTTRPTPHQQSKPDGEKAPKPSFTTTSGLTREELRQIVISVLG